VNILPHINRFCLNAPRQTICSHSFTVGFSEPRQGAASRVTTTGMRSKPSTTGDLNQVTVADAYAHRGFLPGWNLPAGFTTGSST
jgi:hypothetical protein